MSKYKDGEKIGKYYRTDVSDPIVRACYEAYKKKIGLPPWCPMSDKQREHFDDIMINGKTENKEYREKQKEGKQ